MAITVDPQSGEILTDGQGLLFPVDSNFRPAAFLAGLSGEEIVLAAFDSDGRLKVDAQISVPPIEIGSVVIQGTDSSDVIQNIEAVLNSDSTTYSLSVFDPVAEATLQQILAALGGSSGAEIFEYGTATSVASNATVTVVSYTVPGASTFSLGHISASGDNIAIYTVLINGSPVAVKRSWFTDYNIEFYFESTSNGGPSVSAGDTVELQVTNFRPTTGDFNGTIFGQLA